MKIVTCIGDSETWCLGLTRSEAWPYRLCVALDGGGTPSLGTLTPWSNAISTTGAQREHVGTTWTVRNAGVSSDTSRGMKARWATDVLGPAVKPDYVLIMCGENDIYNAAPSGGNDPTYDLNYSPGGLKENVAWMVASANANGITPILCTPTPHGTLETVADRWTRMQDWVKWLGTSMTWMTTSETANTLGCVLSDHYQTTYDAAQPAYPRYYPTGSTYSLDNIHPNAAGAQVIANTAAAAVDAAPIHVSGTVTVTSTVSCDAQLGTLSFDLAGEFVSSTLSFDLAASFVVGSQYAVSGTVLAAATASATIASGRRVSGSVTATAAATLTLDAGTYIVSPTSLASAQYGSSPLQSAQYGSSTVVQDDRSPIS